MTFHDGSEAEGAGAGSWRARPRRSPVEGQRPSLGGAAAGERSVDGSWARVRTSLVMRASAVGVLGPLALTFRGWSELQRYILGTRWALKGTEVTRREQVCRIRGCSVRGPGRRTQRHGRPIQARVRTQRSQEGAVRTDVWKLGQQARAGLRLPAHAPCSPACCSAGTVVLTEVSSVRAGTWVVRLRRCPGRRWKPQDTELGGQLRPDGCPLDAAIGHLLYDKEDVQRTESGCSNPSWAVRGSLGRNSVWVQTPASSVSRRSVCLHRALANAAFKSAFLLRQPCRQTTPLLRAEPAPRSISECDLVWTESLWESSSVDEVLVLGPDPVCLGPYTKRSGHRCAQGGQRQGGPLRGHGWLHRGQGGGQPAGETSPAHTGVPGLKPPGCSASPPANSSRSDLKKSPCHHLD